ncbi:hypothetical protein M3152_00130 [Sporosarcina luteola]|uniref:hypothetical protein n=1 Tax=Bacillales TaxID=1385 RepID=UPI00203B3C90|nr:MULTISPECIES: hypothetical protein [Bacillales]MCM3636106.1 hypothetical protein [Sporosarcina luteola]
MRNWKTVVILVLISIGLPILLLSSKSNKEPFEKYVLGDASIEIYVDGNNYQPVLREGFIFNKKTKTTASQIYRTNQDVYFDYTVFNMGEMDIIVGAVQNNEVKKIVYQVSDLKLEKNVESDKLFVLFLPSDANLRQLSIEHPLIILKQGQTVEYPYKKLP